MDPVVGVDKSRSLRVAGMEGKVRRELWRGNTWKMSSW
jgi:hypothetical protein